MGNISSAGTVRLLYAYKKEHKIGIIIIIIA
jgi:hypothetical protein